MKRLFVLGASTIPGEFIVPKLLSVIIKKLPEIELKVDISDSLVTIKKVKAGVIELGIVGTKYGADEIDYLPVMKDDRLLLIAPPAHPLAEKKRITLRSQGIFISSRTEQGRYPRKLSRCLMSLRRSLRRGRCKPKPRISSFLWLPQTFIR